MSRSYLPRLLPFSPLHRFTSTALSETRPAPKSFPVGGLKVVSVGGIEPLPSQPSLVSMGGGGSRCRPACAPDADGG